LTLRTWLGGNNMVWTTLASAAPGWKKRKGGGKTACHRQRLSARLKKTTKLQERDRNWGLRQNQCVKKRFFRVTRTMSTRRGVPRPHFRGQVTPSDRGKHNYEKDARRERVKTICPRLNQKNRQTGTDVTEKIKEHSKRGTRYR